MSLTTNKIAMILNSLRDIVVVADNDLVIISLNKYGRRFFGWPDEEVKGKNISFLLPDHPNDPPDAPTVMQARHRKGGEFPVVVQVMRDPLATLVAFSMYPINLPQMYDFSVNTAFLASLQPKLSLDDLDVHHRRVLLRVDYNCPLDNSAPVRQITDDARIRATLPTVRRIMRDQGKLIIMSHLGRPKGKPNELLSLKPVAIRLSELIGKPVLFAPEPANAAAMIAKMKKGEVLMIENLRFHPGEDSKKATERQQYAETLAKYGDVFVCDAFGTAHRESASMTALPRVMGCGAAGYLMDREVRFIGKIVRNPQHPLVAIVGGSKVSDKIALLGNLFNIATTVIIGGAMAYSFLEAEGYSVGKSKVERMIYQRGREVDIHQMAKDLLRRASQQKVKILLPVDHACHTEFADTDKPHFTKTHEVPEGFIGMDIGPKTIDLCLKEIRHARAVIWNGPLGVFECSAFKTGTDALARAITENQECVSLVGGGDTAASVKEYRSGFTHVSTGGGATLEMLEGKALPGLVCLTSKAGSKL